MVETMIKTGWNLENSYAQLPEVFFTKIKPTPVQSPKLVLLNERLAESLGLNAESLKSEDAIAVLAGNLIPEDAQPLAQAYAGHQFGHFTILGDGRAILLGEQINPQGKRLDIQLKGSGKTPYSRRGDGRAALGPMLREYIISEAMHALGIETTRSLAVVTTGESIIREMVQPGAILTRIAQSHLRVGTFQYAAALGKIEDLRALADYTIKRHFSELSHTENRYLALLQEVIRRQASLIAKWQLVGFVHGVMNTDNMTISGETIDYGPCAFMDEYDPATVFSSIDLHGRYAYGNQPQIAQWNLARFAEALLPLLNDNEEEAVKMAQEELAKFMELYEDNYLTGMRRKLGLMDKEQEDEALIQELLNMMKAYHADYTNTFRALTFDKLEYTVLFDTPEFTKWHGQWQSRLKRQQKSALELQQLMRNSNPAVIPRNHRVEEALESAVTERDFSVMKRLLDVLQTPFAHSTEQEEYAKLPEQKGCRYRTFCGT